jgi:hypothetical protein
MMLHGRADVGGFEGAHVETIRSSSGPNGEGRLANLTPNANILFLIMVSNQNGGPQRVICRHIYISYTCRIVPNRIAICTYAYVCAYSRRVCRYVCVNVASSVSYSIKKYPEERRIFIEGQFRIRVQLTVSVDSTVRVGKLKSYPELANTSLM